MVNRILNELKKINTLDNAEGVARHQVEREIKSNVRNLLSAVGDDVVPNMKRCIRDADMTIQIMAVDVCDYVPKQYRPDIIKMLQFQLKLEEKREARDNRLLQDKIKSMLSKLGDSSLMADMVKGLKSDIPEERKQTVITLGASASIYKQTLIEVVKTDNNLDVRQTALDKLDLLRSDKDLIELYDLCLADVAKIVRAVATRNLMNSHINDDRVSAILLTHVTHKVYQIEVNYCYG
jgi:hypothetical protein